MISQETKESTESSTIRARNVSVSVRDRGSDKRQLPMCVRLIKMQEDHYVTLNDSSDRGDIDIAKQVGSQFPERKYADLVSQLESGACSLYRPRKNSAYQLKFK